MSAEDFSESWLMAMVRVSLPSSEVRVMVAARGSSPSLAVALKRNPSATFSTVSQSASVVTVYPVLASTRRLPVRLHRECYARR